MTNQTDKERLRRWRLILGGGEADGIRLPLEGRDAAMDEALHWLYGEDAKPRDRRGGLGASSPSVARWLGDIRAFFPAPMVRILQQDALERLNLKQMLLEPELLSALEPDVHLVATLLSLKSLLPARARETARAVVRQVVEDVERKLAQPLRQAVSGSLQRAARTRRPRAAEIDWIRTVHANLKHYQPRYGTIIPETLIGRSRRRSSLQDVILCVDQSGSMASSVVYAGIFASVLASLPALRTRMVVFDTAVVDLTEQLHDPVELLFGVQLGGGTDIHRALTYCHAQVRRPLETVLVLISDLYEGGDKDRLLRRAAALARSGVRMVVLLALNDRGAPAFDHEIAAELAALGIPAFACTPDLFPDLIAAALDRRDLAQWSAMNAIAATTQPG